MRIRDKPIQFLRGRNRGEEVGTPILKWGGIEKRLGDFTLKPGRVRSNPLKLWELWGQTPQGKTTLVKIIAGEIDPDEGWCTMDAKVSYKPQHVRSDFDGTVQELLDSELAGKWRSGEFHTQVTRALQVDKMLELRVKKLSGESFRQCASSFVLEKKQISTYSMNLVLT